VRFKVLRNSVNWSAIKVGMCGGGGLMDRAGLEAGWSALNAEVARELSGWRATHPTATLAELEGAVRDALSQVQARYLRDLVHVSAAADLGAAAPEVRPGCPACGGRLEPRGQATRQVLVPRQAAPLELRRSYGVCSACGVGLFPPG